MIYLKKIINQDVSRTPTFSMEAIQDFFHINLNNGQSVRKSVVLLGNTKSFNIEFKKRETRNEYRIFLKDLFSEINAQVGDILIFKRRDNDYLCEHISTNYDGYNYINKLFEKRSNHQLVEEDGVSEPHYEYSIISRSAFDTSSFNASLDACGLRLSEILTQRFIAALQAKPFVILTGLSGSGKTKLAEAFSSWITNDVGTQQVFTKNQKLSAKKASYIVRDISSANITVESEGKSKAIIPLELIDFWTDVIINNNFDIDTPSQTIQDKVLEKHKDEMTYSKSHNSFHSILKSLALEKAALRGKVDTKSKSKKQVCMVSVGADWTNRESLLGYPNALDSESYVKPDSKILDLILSAQDDPLNPYFLILDEMNMSHVERYFADFLSAMESVNSTISLHSGDKEWGGVPSQVTLPKNLFIIGTVNVDETTYMFSPKVLDRANVIEFRVTKDEMNDYLNSSINLDMKKLNGKGAHMAQDFVSIALGETEKVEGLSDKLMPFFNNLQAVGAEFGYRSASEISRFIGIYNSMNGVIDEHDAIDAAIVQKLLPKLHGSRNKLQRILVILAKQCLYDTSREDAFKDTSEDDIKYPISYEKLKRMHERIMADGFTSFAEA